MKPPWRVLMDTSAYDYFLDEKELAKALQAIRDGKILFYGFKVIRQEVRNIPKTAYYRDENLRQRVLSVYDRIVGSHFYSVNRKIEWTANQYLAHCQGISADEVLNDFLIVACASIHGVDILVSNDKRTMLSENAKKAYEIVNQKNGFSTPRFYTGNEFRLLL